MRPLTGAPLRQPTTRPFSATAPADYTAISTTTLTFDPGETEQFITVNAQGDTLNEYDETFFINLANPENATVGDSQGHGTIQDNDGPPTVVFSGAPYSEWESVGTATVTVTLSVASGKSVTVTYGTSDGTATTADGDYSSASGQLVFAPGETTKSFGVGITGDGRDEPAETVNLELSGAVNAGGAPTSTTLTIQDDDDPPTVDFSSATYSVGEDAGMATIIVTLNAASGLTVTVEYSTTNGTATAGEDYAGTFGTLVFTPGVTSQSFTVGVVDDDVDEGEETVTLTLSNPDNATIGGNSPAVLTITEEFKVYLPLVLRNY
jgi:hypothetical protein